MQTKTEANISAIVFKLQTLGYSLIPSGGKRLVVPRKALVELLASAGKAKED